MTEVRLGTGSAVRIEESYEPNFDAKTFFPDWDPVVAQRHRDWPVPHHYDEPSGWLKLSVHSWLLRIGGRNILIDTCVGNHKSRTHRPKWHLMETIPNGTASPVPMQPVHERAGARRWNTAPAAGAADALPFRRAVQLPHRPQERRICATLRRHFLERGRR